MCTDKNVNPIHPKLLCSRSTFFKKYSVYKSSGVLPDQDDFGDKVGKPQTVKDRNVKDLNNDLKMTIGLGENNTTNCHL